MAERSLSLNLYIILSSIYLIGKVVLAAPWDSVNENGEYSNGCGQSNSFDNGQNFMNYGCGGNENGDQIQSQPYSSQSSSYHHNNNPNVFNHNLLKNLPPGSNTTLIPLGQVLIPTGKEISLCTNQNTQNSNLNANNGVGGGMGSGMFGNGPANGYGSSMGRYGDNSNCCQGYGNMYGQYGQGYGNYMGNSGFMQGQNNNGYGFGSGGYPTDYSNQNGCGGNSMSPMSPMDGCCPCTKRRRRRFVGQLFGHLISKRLRHSKPMSNLHNKNF